MNSGEFGRGEALRQQRQFVQRVAIWVDDAHVEVDHPPTRTGRLAPTALLEHWHGDHHTRIGHNVAVADPQDPFTFNCVDEVQIAAPLRKRTEFCLRSMLGVTD